MKNQYLTRILAAHLLELKALVQRYNQSGKGSKLEEPTFLMVLTRGGVCISEKRRFICGNCWVFDRLRAGYNSADKTAFVQYKVKNYKLHIFEKNLRNMHDTLHIF